MKIEDYMQEAKDVAEMINRRIQIRIPSVLEEGEEFAAQVSVIGADGLPAGDFSRALDLTGSVGIAGMPRSVTPEPGAGSLCIGGLCASGPQVALIRARLTLPGISGGGATVVSNPAWVFNDPPYRIFWGDLHAHTRYSNCHGWRCLDPEWCYLYARDVSLLDFVAPADHLRGIVAVRDRWPRLQELAREYNSPGGFVAFLAFESSHAQGCGGDNNVYFCGDDAPHFWLDREDMHGSSPEVHLRTLWEQMDGCGTPYFTVPHHTGRAVKYRSWNEPYHDPGREPVFEIYSSWGSSEMRHSRLPISGGNNDAASYFVDALRAGARFGVIASSDDHATLPGSVHHFRTEPYRPPTLNGHAHKGLAAVRCGRLTRESLFEAMRRRDVYATTHSRSLVDMHVGDAPMGREIGADAALRRRRSIRLRLTLHDAVVGRVTLMRNGAPLEERIIRGPEVAESVNDVVFEDTDELERVAVRDSLYHDGPFVVYYARVEDGSGAHQWTSPVWIDL